MPLEAPKLDTRTFEELVREARLRIPRYTPEWTDFNDSDPGMTLVQLFAWLSEMMLFQMNKVPERNYIKFLQLLDMELKPAQPARAHLTFTPEPGATRVDSVSRGTPVAAVSPTGGAPILFETEEGMDLVPVPLTDVQVYDGSSFAVVTAANNTAGTSYRPFGWVPAVGSALYLGFDETDTAKREDPTATRNFPRMVRLRTFLHGDGTASGTPEVDLSWEYRAASAPGIWRRLSVYRDDTAALTREGYILLEGPSDALRTAEGKLGTGHERYWLRLRLTSGRYGADHTPELDLLRVNTVPAVNLQTVREEVLGTSAGRPGESFELRQRPVDPDSLELWSEPRGLEPQPWQRVDDLLASGPRDTHFTLNATAGRVAFGDGSGGRIPVAGSRIVARRYRFGGGAAGNLGRGTINTGPPAVAVTNERPAEGGRDEQTVDELKRQAPARLRHRQRAVTAEDFSALAAEAGGVAKATTLAQAHPDFPEITVPGAVTVVVVPESRALPPQPSDELRRQTSRHLDRYRLLTTEVHVRAPTYLEIRVSARVVAAPSQAFDAVGAAVRRALDTFLDPLAWSFGHDLYPTRLYEVILAAPEVLEVANLAVEVDSRPHPSLSESIAVPPDGLIFGSDHQIDVMPEEDR